MMNIDNKTTMKKSSLPTPVLCSEFVLFWLVFLLIYFLIPHLSSEMNIKLKQGTRHLTIGMLRNVLIIATPTPQKQVRLSFKIA